MKFSRTLLITAGIIFNKVPKTKALYFHMVEITLNSDKNLNINNFTLNSFLTKVNVIKSIHSK